VSVAEWLHLHDLNSETVFDCIGGIEGDALQFDFDVRHADRDTVAGPDVSSLDTAIGTVVVPALAVGLSIEPSVLTELVQPIRWGSLQEGDSPQTIDHGVGQPPEIRIAWQGSISDLMCLSHEVAHAVQLQLSVGSFMPPVARETCAFLGELALIGWAKRNQADLAAKLLRVWREDNQRYFGDDCELLRSGLMDPDSAYSYRMNYPLARAAAVVMWRAGADLQCFFKSGSGAMALLPLSKIADLAGQSQNYLPPLPAPDTTQPAIDAYRALGAMALLDIDFWKGESERRIEDYYATLLNHLQNRTAFIALDDVRRPVGYATWRKAAGDNTVTLTRQAAPFGDHLLLQKALERHLGQNTDVQAQHPRSARQEQMAW